LTIALIDYDILVYRCGFAAQRGSQKEGNLVAEPLDHTLTTVKATVKSIVAASGSQGEHYGYLTGRDNYRAKIATIKPYKGNRRGLEKPVWYDEIRAYLVSHCNGQIIDGREADDELAIHFYKNPKHSVICSTDKDFNQLPNVRLFDWVKKEFKTFTEKEAHRNFWLQVLTGDSVDNIPGIPGIGPKKAHHILPYEATYREYSDLCLAQYKQHYKENGTKYFIENCRLLYLMKSEDDSWEKYVREKRGPSAVTAPDLNEGSPKTVLTEESSLLTKDLNLNTSFQNKSTPIAPTSS